MCKSVFKDGSEVITTEKFTKIFVMMINLVEKNKQK